MQTSLDFLPRYSVPLLLITAASILACFLIVRLATGPAVSLAKSWGLWTTRVVLILLLVGLLANPVHVAELSGDVEPGDVFFLLDASQSMALDDAGATRWDQAVEMIRDSARESAALTNAHVNLFRFGRRLEAIPAPQAIGLSPSDFWPAAAGGPAPSNPESDTEPNPHSDAVQIVPDDPDTQLRVALRQITSRFGRRRPAGLVVFSDGRARDGEGLEEIVEYFENLGVPIHVVPLGDAAKGGDVSLISLIAPATVRKYSQVNVEVFVRSYGYSGRRAEVELWDVDSGGDTPRKLHSAPLTLSDGFQSVSLSFRTDERIRTLRARVEPLTDEITLDNNQFDTDVRVDRTKIRVLYVEGSPARFTTVERAGRLVLRGAHSNLQEALEEDPDIECTVLAGSAGELVALSGQIGTFPRTPAELAAYDAILLSNVSSSQFTDEQLGWIEQWINRRGAGLCMVGGSQSFSAGGWNGSPLEKVLPVRENLETGYSPVMPITVRPLLTAPLHPIFHLLEDQIRNREALAAFPGFGGGHPGLVANAPVATVLAVGAAGNSPPAGGDAGFAAITAGRYGQGRTLAMAFPITSPAAEQMLSWGPGGNPLYTRFWRNTVYWLTENSFIGRRRLSASADKRFYQPGETVTLTAAAFDEAANPTTNYRMMAMLEPQTLDIDSDYAPIRWPSGIARTDGNQGQLVMWGEEFEIPSVKSDDGRTVYSLRMELAEAHAVGAAGGGMRLELTAYEDLTQVDSTSLPVQVIHDPFEQQNPFPDHRLLEQLAAGSGGRVITGAQQLADLLREVPVVQGAAEVRTTPLWDNWWLLLCLMGLLTVEWCWRRRVGLA